MGRLGGKVAVVIGGASGFGLGTVERFAAEGATVVVAGRRGELAAEVGERFGGWGTACDVTVEADVEALFAATVERAGGVDVAVNYAGFEQSVPIRDLEVARLRAMVDVQFIGALTFLRHAGNAMAAGGGGSIVAISSFTAHAPSVGLAAYAGSKAGLEYVTRIAALEYGPSNVRVNCVAPHLIETPMTARIFAVPLVVEAVRQQTPLGRMGTIDDVVNAVLFLASDESSFISGQTLCIDGAAGTQKLPAPADYATLATLRPDLR